MTSRRTAILDAATWLFSMKGYRETSTTDVARMTGSADGTVFYHFESKEKLFLAVLENTRKTIDQAFREFLPTTDDMSGNESFEAVVAFYLQLAADHEARFILLQRHQAYDLAATNEECRSLLEAIYETIINAFEKVISRGQEDGSFTSLSAHKTALLVFTLLDGLVRLRNYRLYDADSMFEDFLDGCRRLLVLDKG